MLAYKNRRANTDNPGFINSTNIRYMVIFSDSAVFNFITFMLFYKKYLNIQVIIINGHTRNVTA